MILTEPTIQARFGRRLRRRALAAFVDEAAAAVKLRGEVAALLTTDADIRRLNRTFRKKNKPTDVLSFPAPEPLPGQQPAGGDLAISVETAERQAEETGHALSVELQILLLHGVLHLAGYDHETDTGQMARREALLRRRFGLQAGLIERAAKNGARR
jgi:probable rRNA maturation factor